MGEEEKEYYGEYLPALCAAEKELLEQIGRILSALTTDEECAPAEHVRSRIKRAQSTKNKLVLQGYPTDAGTALGVLSDVVGVRVVTHFVGDVYEIVTRLQAVPGWEVLKVKDYISNPKPNGYRSLHVIVKLPFAHADIPFLAVEVQLRTIAMDCWASLEHQMKYKKHIENVQLIEAELKRCADEMASTDLSMQTLREMIHAQ